MNNEVRELIKSDLVRCGVSKFSVWSLLKLVIRDSTVRFLVSHRMGHYYYKRKCTFRLRLISLLYWLGIVNSHNSEIPFAVDIGPGLYIGHFNGITISPDAKLGKNVNIHKGVTIGQENRGRRRGVPLIGNNVYIGINSVVVGNIVIGDNVLIAPNAHVNCDVPPNSIVFGNPAIIKRVENATQDYVNDSMPIAK